MIFFCIKANKSEKLKALLVNRLNQKSRITCCLSEKEGKKKLWDVKYLVKQECNISLICTFLQPRQAIILEVMEANLRSLNTRQLHNLSSEPKNISAGFLLNLPICVLQIFQVIYSSVPAPKFDSPSPQDSFILFTFPVILPRLMCCHPSSHIKFHGKLM